MTQTPYHLFEVFGVELEYMIVDKDSLKVRPIADLLIKEVTGMICSDVDRGRLGWSNELVVHVIELKTNGPSKTLKGLSDAFAEEVAYINQLLSRHNACLLPTGAHPFFKPESETVIWPHEYNEVYALYDRIFDCKGHGWSNLQSTHLNLPFSGDIEFGALHAAVRVLLPLIPALSASTPIIEGKLTGHFDTRMDYYRKNQQKIPEIAGLVVPEAVFTRSDYVERIFAPIQRVIRPHDTDNILDRNFLNSRGAIARFDRNAIEIRVIDIQECPRADLAIIELIVASLKWLMKRFELENNVLRYGCTTEALASILITTSQYGSSALIEDKTYLAMFDLDSPVQGSQLWQHLYQMVEDDLSEDAQMVIEKILAHGNLSERMSQCVAGDNSEQAIFAMYKELERCLGNNELFIPCCGY